MRFAHLADCHIGSWRDPKLRDISTKAFAKAVDLCIEENIDFMVIAGDMFNTSLPPIDSLKEVTLKLKQLKDKDIQVYIVPGSHDFSPSGKTILDVLENAGLLINVARGKEVNGKLQLNFTVDKKTGAKITGLLGKKGGLEKNYYFNLVRENLENEDGYKIFLFHSLLTELKPAEFEQVDSAPLSLLPKNFNYYAGGHPHFIFSEQLADYGTVSYPGPLFPNNFRELEKLGNGGFYIVKEDKVTFEPIQIYNTYSIKINCNNKIPEEIEDEILSNIKNKELMNTIVTIRLFGVLKSGKPSSIDFRKIFKAIYDKSAYFVMKNTNKLTTKEFEEIKTSLGSVEETESSLIRENIGQKKIRGFDKEKETELIKNLMDVLSNEKIEDEKKADFEKRISAEIKGILDYDIL